MINQFKNTRLTGWLSWNFSSGSWFGRGSRLRNLIFYSCCCTQIADRIRTSPLVNSTGCKPVKNFFRSKLNLSIKKAPMVLWCLRNRCLNRPLLCHSSSRMLLQRGTKNGQRWSRNEEQGTVNLERGTENEERRTGNGEQGTENGERRTKNGERRTRNGERGTENKKRRILNRTRNGEWGTENGKRWTRNGERGTENGERRTRNGERRTRNGEFWTENEERRMRNGERGTENEKRRTGNGSLGPKLRRNPLMTTGLKGSEHQIWANRSYFQWF